MPSEWNIDPEKKILPDQRIVLEVMMIKEKVRERTKNITGNIENSVLPHQDTLPSVKRAIQAAGMTNRIFLLPIKSIL